MESFPRTPETQSMAKTQQQWGEITLHAQRYSGNLKGYSYIYNMNICMSYVFEWYTGQTLDTWLFWLMVRVNVAFSEHRSGYHCSK